MATKITMEALSPTMEEGRLVKWTKNEGDQVKSGDVLAEVETDKAIRERVARGDGGLRRRLANEGDSSAIGTLLAVIAAPDENIDSIIGSAAPGAASPPPGATGGPSGTPPPLPRPPRPAPGPVSGPGLNPSAANGRSQQGCPAPAPRSARTARDASR